MNLQILVIALRLFHAFTWITIIIRNQKKNCEWHRKINKSHFVRSTKCACEKGRLSCDKKWRQDNKRWKINQIYIFIQNKARSSTYSIHSLNWIESHWIGIELFLYKYGTNYGKRNQHTIIIYWCWWYIVKWSAVQWSE